MSHDFQSAGGRAAFGHAAQSGAPCAAAIAPAPTVVRLPGAAAARVRQRPGRVAMGGAVVSLCEARATRAVQIHRAKHLAELRDAALSGAGMIAGAVINGDYEYAAALSKVMLDICSKVKAVLPEGGA